MTDKKYNIIYADPPWQFKNYNDQTASRWVGDHYPILEIEDIYRLPVQSIAADDCALFLWGTWPMLPKCLGAIEKWDFTYKTVAFVWVKLNDDGTPFTGMGYWTRSNTEYCWLATRGHPQRVNASVHQVVSAARGKHSAKPPIVREKIVQLMGDLPRIELFARKPEPTLFGDTMAGWDVWGNEVESDIELLP